MNKMKDLLNKVGELVKEAKEEVKNEKHNPKIAQGKLNKEEIIEINQKLGKEFNTDFGLGGNYSNLDYALTLKQPYDIAKELLRGHPFIDGNKRTSFMVYMLLTTPKKYEDILNDFRDILLSLSR